MREFQKSDFSVTREHSEFIWLHDRFEENDDYIGYIIPPAPPKPNFDRSREKLQKLGEGEGLITKEEFNKMKAELEAEYLATFKKTVEMHEAFLKRLATHEIFRKDHNFRVFLEYDKDLSVRTKNRKERIEGLVKYFSKSTDEYLSSSVHQLKDVNDFFEQEKNFLHQYHAHLRTATTAADRMVAKHNDVAEISIRIAKEFAQLATIDHRQLDRFLNITADTLEKASKFEHQVAADEDLKLSDTLRYYLYETEAAKNLLYRRFRCLSEYEAANKNLERARSKNREVQAAEGAQLEACEKFEIISEKGKKELVEFKKRRVDMFKRNLIDLADLEIKHARDQADLLSKYVDSLRADAHASTQVIENDA